MVVTYLCFNFQSQARASCLELGRIIKLCLIMNNINRVHNVHL